MESYKGVIIEHPLVRRVKAMLSRPSTPILTVKDAFQPSHGSLKKHLNFLNRVQDQVNPNKSLGNLPSNN